MISKIRKNLENNYDASILDIASDDIKETLKNIVTEAKDSGKGNIPLINIIYNYFYGVLPSPKYISGPMSLTYHTSESHDMKIYIFGESHGITKQCGEYQEKSSYLDISEYLQKVFLNSDKFIDFYLEDVLFRTKEVSRNNFLLNHLRYDFRKCLNPTTRSECIYKTVRTHFVDTRTEQEGSKLIRTNIFSRFIDFLRIYRDYNTYDEKDSDEFEEFGNKLLYNCKNYTDISMFFIDIAKNVPIIKKALKRCDLDPSQILYFFSEFLPVYYSKNINISKLRSTILNLLDDNLTDADITSLMDILTSVEAPLVDIYTICRMFKTFKNTNNLPTSPRHIIYYAGNFHSDIVRTFLTYLKFKKHINIKQDISSRCLDINGVKLDFKK